MNAAQLWPLEYWIAGNPIDERNMRCSDIIKILKTLENYVNCLCGTLPPPIFNNCLLNFHFYLRLFEIWILNEIFFNEETILSGTLHKHWVWCHTRMFFLNDVKWYSVGFYIFCFDFVFVSTIAGASETEFLWHLFKYLAQFVKRSESQYMSPDTSSFGSH